MLFVYGSDVSVIVREGVKRIREILKIFRFYMNWVDNRIAATRPGGRAVVAEGIPPECLPVLLKFSNKIATVSSNRRNMLKKVHIDE